MVIKLPDECEDPETISILPLELCIEFPDFRIIAPDESEDEPD